MRALGQQARARTALLGAAKVLFRKLSARIPTSNVWEHLFPHSLTNPICCKFPFSPFSGKKWYHVLFKCASLVLSGADHLFMSFTHTHTELSMSFLQFSIGFFIPQWSSLYIRDISPLSVMYVASMFSQFVSCLLTMLWCFANLGEALFGGSQDVWALQTSWNGVCFSERSVAFIQISKGSCDLRLIGSYHCHVFH